jgi:hypothetical protein
VREMTLFSIRSLTLSQWSNWTTDDYVVRLMSSSDSTSERILDKLEAIDLRLVEIVVERVTVVEFRMDYGVWKWLWWRQF